jgi:hypothetical protein
MVLRERGCGERAGKEGRVGFYFALCFRYGYGGRPKVGSEDEGFFRRCSCRSSSSEVLPSHQKHEVVIEHIQLSSF